MDIHWNSEQKDAIARIVDWGHGYPQELSLTGPAGTGKTLLLSVVQSLVSGAVMWTAMTGKAALRMREASGVAASTLHSVLYESPDHRDGGGIEFTRVAEPKGKFLVIDESSMLTPTIYEDLKIWKRKGVQILYVGDGYQLPPVLSNKEIEQHGADFSVFRLVDGPALKTVMRSGDDVIAVATILRQEGHLPKKSNGGYQYIRTETPGNKAISDFIAAREDHALITWRNAYRMEANFEIRKRLGIASKLPIKGEPVLIRKNGQKVLNGEIYGSEAFRAGPKIGEVETHWFETADGKQLLVETKGKQEYFDGMKSDIKDWKAYVMSKKMQKLPDPLPVTFAYCLTAHVAQGSEFKRVSVFLSASDLRNPIFREDTKLPNGETMSLATRFLYTSLTRAKEQVSVILGM